MGCQFSNDAQMPKAGHKFPCQLFFTEEVVPNNPQTSRSSQEKELQESLIDKSIRYYQDFIERHPHINCRLDGLGNLEDQIGYIEGKVQKWYKEQRQLGLIMGNPYDSLSLCYSLKEDVSQGIKWYHQMTHKHPNLYELYFGLGNLYYKLENFQQSEQQYRKCIQLKPQFAKAYQAIANIYCYKKFSNQLAKQWARFALKLNPSNQYAGLIYTLTQENVEERINLLMKLRQACPNYARLCNAFGAAFFEINHVDKAIQWYLKGYQINPNYYAICCSLGLAYSQKIDNRNVVSKEQQMPKNLDSQQSRKHKKVLNFNSSLDQAEKWYRKCVGINPNLLTAWYELAMISISRQMYKQAAQHLQKCIQVNPRNLECYICLAKIYIKKKQHTLATKYINQILQILQNKQQIPLVIKGLIEQLTQIQHTKNAQERGEKI